MTDENMNDHFAESPAASGAVAKHGALHPPHWKLEFWLLCGMLVLALVGLGVTQASAEGAWEFWLIAVLAFCSVGVFHASKLAKHAGTPVWPMVLKQLLHWAGLLIVLKVLVLLERTDTISRESASDCSLILLALTCYLAGIHFDWMFLVLGLVLAVMVIVLGTVQQYSFLLWVIMIPVAAAGAGAFYVKAKQEHAA